MNRITILLAAFALGSSLGFAQEKPAPTVADSDVKIDQLRRTINGLRHSVQTNQKATLDTIVALQKDLRDAERKRQADREKLAADELRRQQEQDRQKHEQQMFVAKISGGLLFIGAVIGGFIWFRVRKHRNQNAATQPTVVQSSVQSAEVSTMQPAKTYAPIHDDPKPKEMKMYAQSTGSRDFPVKVIPKPQNIPIEGRVKVDRDPMDPDAIFWIEFEGSSQPRWGLDSRYDGAAEVCRRMFPPPSDSGQGLGIVQ